MVDDVGNPLIVYHGTASADKPLSGGEFPGMYFSPDKQYAEVYASLKEGEHQEVREYYLKIINLKIVSKYGEIAWLDSKEMENLNK